MATNIPIMAGSVYLSVFTTYWIAGKVMFVLKIPFNWNLWIIPQTTLPQLYSRKLTDKKEANHPSWFTTNPFVQNENFIIFHTKLSLPPHSYAKSSHRCPRSAFITIHVFEGGIKVNDPKFHFRYIWGNAFSRGFPLRFGLVILLPLHSYVPSGLRKACCSKRQAHTPSLHSVLEVWLSHCSLKKHVSFILASAKKRKVRKEVKGQIFFERNGEVCRDFDWEKFTSVANKFD